MPELMRQSLESLIAKFKNHHARYALLTSFNFSAGFFERNLLPMLAGYDFSEAESAIVDLEQFNQRLAEVDILVACDRCTQPEPKGDFNYGLLPVGLENGFFHPKLTLLAGELADGERGAFAMVSSGNLTLSGWALNREVVGHVRIGVAQAIELDRLLAWLLQQANELRHATHAVDAKEEGDPVSALTGLREYIASHCHKLKTSPSPRILVQLPVEYAAVLPGSNRSMIDRLCEAGSFRKGIVVSPFWSDVDRMLHDFGFQTARLVPSLNPSGDCRFPDDPAREHWDFAAFDKDTDRYTHAKAIWAESEDGHAMLSIGSSNFTSAAMGFKGSQRRNVEVMLSFEGDNIRQLNVPSLVDIPRERLAPPDEADNEEGMVEAPPYEACAAYDWASQAFSFAIRWSSGISPEPLVVQFGGRSLSIKPLPRQWHEARLSMELRRPVRACFVSRDGQSETGGFRVLVAQLNATQDQLGYVEPPRLSDVMRLLLSLGPDSTSQDIQTQAERGRSSVSPDEDDQLAALYDYDAFSMFQAFYKLRKHYSTKRDFHPLDDGSPLSLFRILRAVEQQVLPEGDHAAIVHRFLLLSELALTARQFGIEERSALGKTFLARLEVLTHEVQPHVEEQLRTSPAFKAFLGSQAHTAQAVDCFMDWFRKELVQASEMKVLG